MKNAVVFGGSGFIGSHVADHLSELGYRTTIFDVVASPWLGPSQVMLVGNILDADAVTTAVEGADVVYNFAGLADLNQALDKPLETVGLNIVGNLNVMEACRINGVGRFMYASTVYVHSREGGFYRCSKQASETYVEQYQQSYGLDYTILRYGSLYGPRANESNGMLRIVKSALENGTLQYRGHIDTMREYIHVEDAAKASVVMLEEEFKNKSVILTGQEPMKVLDVLKIIGEIIGLSEDAVEFTDGNYTGHYVRTPYAYRNNLGQKYIPPLHVDLGQGILQVIETLKNSK